MSLSWEESGRAGGQASEQANETERWFQTDCSKGLLPTTQYKTKIMIDIVYFI